MVWSPYLYVFIFIFIAVYAAISAANYFYHTCTKNRTRVKTIRPGRIAKYPIKLIFENLCSSLRLGKIEKHRLSGYYARGEVGKQLLSVSLKGIFGFTLSVTLNPPANASYALCIRRQKIAAKSEIIDARDRVLRRFAVGDETFDNFVIVYGENERTVIALLDERTRHALETLFDSGKRFLVESNRISYAASLSAFRFEEKAVETIRLLHFLAKSIGSTANLEARLVQNLLHDKYYAVRSKNLAVLSSLPAYGKTTKAAFQKIIDRDFNIDLVIACARGLGNYSCKIFYRFFDTGNPDDVIGAIWAIGDTKTRLDIKYFIDLLENKIEKIGDEGDKWRIRIEIIKLLGKKGNIGGSAALLKFIHSEDHDIRDEAIKALATCGKLNAIEPLVRLSKTSIANPFLRKQILATIHAIQKRQGVREYGALSMMSDNTLEGAVSLDEGKDGELAIEPENKSSRKPRAKKSKRKGKRYILSKEKKNGFSRVHE